MNVKKANTIEMEVVTDPEEIRQAKARDECFQRNLAWFQEHAPEIYLTHRGKCICISGQELFVADSSKEVLALARAAHPLDEGRFTHYIPRERLARIYAAQRHVVAV